MIYRFDIKFRLVTVVKVWFSCTYVVIIEVGRERHSYSSTMDRVPLEKQPVVSQQVCSSYDLNFFINSQQMFIVAVGRNAPI